MDYSSITEELLKQFNQLPLEFQKKALEFTIALNTTTLKDKPGKDLLVFAGSIDQDSLKAMEEAVAYEEEECKESEADFSWDQFYGISKGLWQEDAQEYVKRLRDIWTMEDIK